MEFFDLNSLFSLPTFLGGGATVRSTSRCGMKKKSVLRDILMLEREDFDFYWEKGSTESLHQTLETLARRRGGKVEKFKLIEGKGVQCRISYLKGNDKKEIRRVIRKNQK